MFTLLPLLVGAIFAALSVGGLGYVVWTGKGGRFLPLFVAISFLVVLMHLMSVWMGVSLPLFRVNYGMQNP